MAERYRVTLTAEERGGPESMIRRGKADASELAHARVLLRADEAGRGPGRAGPGHRDVAAAPDLSVRTAERIRRRFAEEGLDSDPLPKPSTRIYARVLDGAREAKLIALACLRPPEGSGSV